MKELSRAKRQDELGKARLQLQAEMATHGATHVDADIVKSYAEDLKGLLKEADIIESKSFLRSFIKRIEINKSEGIIHYSLPVPSCRGDMQSAGVLPIDNYGGAEGTRTPDFLLAKEALSQLSYSPTSSILPSLSSVLLNIVYGVIA